MAINPRHSSILNLLQNFRQMSVAELTERLGVSQVTIRKICRVWKNLGWFSGATAAPGWPSR
jgi:DNA-binding Lrp family transcriptional regulator